MDVHTNNHTRTHFQAQTQTYKNTLMHTHIHTRTHIHTHIYTHANTQTYYNKAAIIIARGLNPYTNMHTQKPNETKTHTPQQVS